MHARGGTEDREELVGRTRLTGFIGRRPELDIVDGLLNTAANGAGTTIIVSGEPGIGKTRLAEEIVARARSGGFITAWSSSWELGANPAYWAWTQLLRELTSVTEPAVGAADAQLLARVLGSVDDAADGGGEIERIETFDAVVRLLRRATSKQPALFVLDDLQWADPSSVLLADYVTSHLHDVRMVVVITFRDTEPTHAKDALERISRVAHTAALEPLDAADAMRMIEAVAGQDIDPSRTRAVAARCGGNPFFLHELTRLAVAGDLDPASVTRLPSGVRAVLERRFARLPQPTLGALAIAASIGSVFSVDVVRAVAALDALAVLERIEPAVVAGLVRHEPDPVRFSFAHPLVREVLVESLPLTARAQIHRDIAETLMSSPELATGPGEIAHHLRSAVPLVERARAVPYDISAGKAALARTAFDEAIVHLSSALDAIGSQDVDVRCEVLLDLGDAQRKGGRRTEARTTFLEAAGLAHTSAEPSLLARAALGIGDLARDVGLGSSSPDSVAISLIEAALAQLPDADSALRVRLLNRLSVERRYWTGDLAPAEAAADESVAMARRLGDTDLIAESVMFRAMHSHVRHRDLMNEFEEVSRDSADPRFVIARAALGMVDATSRMNLTDLIADSSMLGSVASRYPTIAWIGDVQAGLRAHIRGDLAEAERCVLSVMALPSALRGPIALTHASTLYFFVIRDVGRFDEIESAMRGWARERFTPVGSAMYALLLAELGKHDAAAIELAPLLQPDAIWRDRNSNACIWICAMTAARIGRVDACRFLDEVISRIPYRSVGFGLPSAVPGPWEHVTMALASVLGDHERVDSQFREAVAVADRMDAPIWRAWVHADHAHALARRGDQDGARRAAATAIEEAERHGALGVVAHARQASGDDAPLVPAAAAMATLRREGDVWFADYQGRAVRVRDAKGLGDIATLIARSGHEVHVAELVGAVDLQGSKASDPLLDERALAEYRARLAELDEGDDAEREAIANQLAADLGLFGRSRTQNDWVERARKAVRTRITNTLKRIEAEHEPLARHLRASIRTGVFCVYDPPDRVDWQL